MRLRRLWQVLKYGVKDAKTISNSPDVSKNSFLVFVDILLCYFRHGVWSNQYKNAQIYLLSGDEKVSACRKFGVENNKREQWLRVFFDDRDFYIKYGNVKYERLSLRGKRIKAYTERFNAGKNLTVEFDVNISRQHYLDGTISIGNDVLLAKHVFIDYSGQVVIDDKVKIAAGVSIESHHRDLDAYINGDDVNIPTALHICEGAYIGTNAIVLDSCNYIGKFARIGAGAVVTKDIPDYAVAVGVPAKVIRYLKLPVDNDLL